MTSVVDLPFRGKRQEGGKGCSCPAGSDCGAPTNAPRRCLCASRTDFKQLIRISLHFTILSYCLSDPISPIGHSCIGRKYLAFFDLIDRVLAPSVSTSIKRYQFHRFEGSHSAKKVAFGYTDMPVGSRDEPPNRSNPTSSNRTSTPATTLRRTHQERQH